jgi:hypothetical protein
VAALALLRMLDERDRRRTATGTDVDADPDPATIERLSEPELDR